MNKIASFLISASAVLLVIEGQTLAQERDASKTEYLSSCGACHGSDAKGKGPIVNQLKVAPADLTQLAKKNGGVFSSNAVYEKIDGRQEVKAHGTRDMPIWGYRYSPWPNISPEQPFDPKSVLSKPPSVLDVPTEPSYDLEVVIRRRVLSLIDYLNRVQEK